MQSWEHYSSVRNNAGPHEGEPTVNVTPREAPVSSRKRPSPSVSDEDEIPRASKRRSPLPLFDSDSTPECTESSSDESNGPISSQSHLDIPEPEQMVKPQKLTIKLRGLRTTDAVELPEPLTVIPRPINPTPEPVPSSHLPPSLPAPLTVDLTTNSV